MELARAVLLHGVEGGREGAGGAAMAAGGSSGRRKEKWSLGLGVWKA
jgi:hypothetical protein